MRVNHVPSSSSLTDFHFLSYLTHLGIHRCNPKKLFCQVRKASGTRFRLFVPIQHFRSNDRPVVYEAASQREETFVRFESSTTDGQTSLYVHVHAYTYVHTRMHIYICTCHLHTYVHAYIHTHTSRRAYTQLRTCVRTYRGCIHVYVQMDVVQPRVCTFYICIPCTRRMYTA